MNLLLRIVIPLCIMLVSAESMAGSSEEKAERLYSKGLELEVQGKPDKALIYYRDILLRYANTEVAKAAKVKILNKQPPVRIKHYLAKADGTALDTKTGLVWMRCSVGQTWQNNRCEGKAKRFEWEEAKALQSSFAGYTDWRLPMIEELRTLVYCSNGNKKPSTTANNSGCDEKKYGAYTRPTIVKAVFPNTSPKSIVWSGSPHANDSYYAWGVHFYYGDGSYYDRYVNRHVRLVRGGQ